ncbi:unnamed protein product [Rhizoctonia solani]|uniref:F-box domain-containing protein n=1 Tax=Rhizoctonia solani TaxID=456999 RepID=A0A8H3AWU9_9AGAM|nr:unnamed protein product [Rhizoctonia solani]
MSMPDRVPCTAVERWEAAGASLVTTIDAYMNLCLNLGTNPPVEDGGSEDLVSKIDYTLATIRTTIFRHLHKSSSTLARTRNRLASPFFRFPVEIMSKIFMSVVHDHSIMETPLTMEQEIRRTYCHIYTLLGICTAWRDIVMTRGAFWSVIPIITSQYNDKWQPSLLSLQRAGRSPLHLAVAVRQPASSGELTTVLAKYGTRFRTINISVTNPAEIMAGIGSWLLQQNTPRSLSELSIRCASTHDQANRLPQSSDYIIPRYSTHQGSFAKLVGMLTTFRVSGAQLHWDVLTFSTQLVELQIGEVVLGHDDAVVSLVRALSSAICLRDLKVNSVSTFHTLGAARNSRVTLPSLKSLFIKDLYLNTLQRFLSILTPGPYHLTIFLTRNSITINSFDDGKVVDFDGLCRALEHTPVHVLMINGLLEDERSTTWRLPKLLKTMSTLKTLKLHNWSFSGGLCKALTRISEGHPFPALQNLHLSAAEVRIKSNFRDLIASYPLRKVVLGGKYQVVRRDQTVGWKSFQEDSSIITWLRGNMPGIDLYLINDGHCPPEFRRDEWELW